MAKKKPVSKTKKKFSLTWIYEELEDEVSFATKRMFGGLAVYYNGLMVLMLAEDSGNKEYRGKEYSYEIWNGLLLPTFRVHHEDIIKDFPELIVHPVLGKWLYLKMDEEEFESRALEIVSLIKSGDERFGIVPKGK